MDNAQPDKLAEALARAMCFQDGPEECGCDKDGKCVADMEPTNIWFDYARACLPVIQSLSAHPAGDVALLREAHEHLMQAASITGNLAWQSELNRLTARIDASLATPAAPTDAAALEAALRENLALRCLLGGGCDANNDGPHQTLVVKGKERFCADCGDKVNDKGQSKPWFNNARLERATARLTALRASTGTPAEGEVLDPEEFFATAIDDSLDMDWTGTVGAKAILRRMEEQGLVLCAR